MPSATISITNNHGTRDLVAGRTIRMEIDHKALVDARRSRADGMDLWVRYTGSDPVGKLAVHVVNPNTTTTIVFFGLQNIIEAGATDDDYVLVFGDLGLYPLKNPADVVLPHQSWGQPWLGNGAGNGGVLAAADRRHPFLVVDHLNKKHSSGVWSPYVASDTLDSTVWNQAPGWSHDGDSAITVPSGTQALASVKQAYGDFDVSMRCRAFAKYTGTPALGPLFGLYIAVDGFNYWTCNWNANAGVFAIYVVVAGTGLLATTVAYSGTSPQDNYLEYTLGYDRENNPTSDRWVATVNGTKVEWTDVAVTSWVHSFVGFFNSSIGGAGGTVSYDCVMWELWDGVDDDDVDASISVPALAFPTAGPSYPSTEIIGLPSVANRFPEFLSPRYRTVSTAGIVQQELYRFELTWRHMDPEQYYELIAYYHSTNGAGIFSYSNSGLSGTFRMVPGTLITGEESVLNLSASITLEEVRL